MDTSESFKSSMMFDGFEKQEHKIAPDSVDIFESIKINDDFEDEEYRRKTRKRLITILVSSIILVLLIIATVVGILVPMQRKESSPISANQKSSIEAICNSTLYKDSCYSSIYSMKMSSKGNPGPDSDGPEAIFMLSLQVALAELLRLRASIPKRLISMKQNDDLTKNTLNICQYLIQDAVDHVNMSISIFQLDKTNDKFSNYVVSDIRTWLSTAITDQQTCLDGLKEFKSISTTLQKEMRAKMRNATEFTSNSLAIISNMFEIFQGFKFLVHRKLLEDQRHTGFQGLIHRRLMEEEGMNLTPNLTVAKDGSGDYKTIMNAVNAMPKRSKDRFFVYVKEGEYVEKVVVKSNYWNLMIYGDGMNKTIVSGNQNYADGVATFDSGTLIAEGRGFIAKDMAFKNTAGPDKFQAVAIRSSSEQSIFHKCHIDGYQDTLYAHTNRQFYRDCLITGTIDFIFGNAAAVFQNCTIQPRQPGPGKYNVITAQGKCDPNQNTGISIQRCVISSFDDLTVQTFLGRPWNNHSTTIIMESDIQGIIDPAGWISWDSDKEVNSLFYAEYENSGAGSVLDHRVEWIGYKKNITQKEAEKFCVEEFIQGRKWLNKGNVEYDPYI